MIALESMGREDNRPSTATIRELDVDVMDKNKDVERDPHRESIPPSSLAHPCYNSQQTMIYERPLLLTFILFRIARATYPGLLTQTMTTSLKFPVRSFQRIYLLHVVFS
jgi:hypothetical protein